jgi:hypothetical protein
VAWVDRVVTRPAARGSLAAGPAGSGRSRQVKFQGIAPDHLVRAARLSFRELAEGLGELLEGLVAELGAKLCLDSLACAALLDKVLQGAGGECHGLLAAAGGRRRDQQVAAIPQSAYDLARALAGDAEALADFGDCDAHRIRAHPQYGRLGELAVGEPRGRHLGVDAAAVAGQG